MKIVILAGGLGTRISEESHLKPKPMIEIGEYPILLHIMKYYSFYGFNDFIICAGYKQYIIKEYFSNYFLHNADIMFDFGKGVKTVLNNYATEPWKVTVVDTGLNTMTGGRIKRVSKYVGNETFMMTYGDGLCDIDINALIHFHKSNNALGTITAIRPVGKFGVVEFDESNVIKRFTEKSREDGGWINGGYMVLEPEVLDLIEDDNTVFEKDPMEMMAKSGKLFAYKHEGFWKCMDTLRDKNELEAMWKKGNAPWKR